MKGDLVPKVGRQHLVGIDEKRCDDCGEKAGLSIKSERQNARDQLKLTYKHKNTFRVFFPAVDHTAGMLSGVHHTCRTHLIR